MFRCLPRGMSGAVPYRGRPRAHPALPPAELHGPRRPQEPREHLLPEQRLVERFDIDSRTFL